MSAFIKVAPLEDVPEPGNRAFDIDGRSILICRSAGHVFAIENRCTHALMPLEGGRVRGVHLFCPAHGARFDLRDGSTAGALTSTAVPTFNAKVEDGQIWVALRDPPVS